MLVQATPAYTMTIYCMTECLMLAICIYSHISNAILNLSLHFERIWLWSFVVLGIIHQQKVYIHSYSVSANSQNTHAISLTHTMQDFNIVDIFWIMPYYATRCFPKCKLIIAISEGTKVQVGSVYLVILWCRLHKNNHKHTDDCTTYQVSCWQN